MRYRNEPVYMALEPAKNDYQDRRMCQTETNDWNGAPETRSDDIVTDGPLLTIFWGPRVHCAAVGLVCHLASTVYTTARHGHLNFFSAFVHFVASVVASTEFTLNLRACRVWTK